MQKITPFIWFNGRVNEALELYKNTFTSFNSSNISYFPTETIENAPKEVNDMKGEIMTVDIEIHGYKMSILNGGQNPNSTLNPSISFSIWSGDMEYLKKIWNNLSKNGKVMMELNKYDFGELYGWCNDEFGVSWQVFYVKDNPGKIIPSLMFIQNNNGKAIEAMQFYSEIFPNSKIDSKYEYGVNQMGEDPKHLMHAEFELCNQLFICMDSGLKHEFNFNDGVSFLVSCDGQEEVDKYWNYFVNNGGEEVQCGWCNDKYGVRWQIVPKQLSELLSNPDREIANHAMNQMMKMKKIVIEDLKK